MLVFLWAGAKSVVIKPAQAWILICRLYKIAASLKEYAARQHY